LKDFTLKDVDLENLLFMEHLKIDIPSEDARQIIITLKRDIEFLSSLKLMDYSLLLAIEKIDRK
jgi:hypothetical protein